MDAKPIAQLGDVFALGEHRVICGDATDPAVLAILMPENDKARLILTDDPYNVPVAGHVTSGAHREFLMASGEMTDAEFRAFNTAWIGASLPHLSLYRSQHEFLLRIDAVNLEHVLGDIQADRGNLYVDGSPSCDSSNNDHPMALR